MATQASGMPGAYPTRCLPEQTGGLFVGAETKDQLVAALRTTLGCAFSSQLDQTLTVTRR
jgi:Ca-activated chloride channel family protein